MTQRAALAPLLTSLRARYAHGMNTLVESIRDALASYAQLTPAERAAQEHNAAALRHANDDEVVAVLADIGALASDQLHAAQVLVTTIVEHFAQRARLAARDQGPTGLSPESRAHITKIYNDLRANDRTAWALLGWLAALRGRHELALFAELLVAMPPGDVPQLAVAFGPLFQWLDYDAGALFPKLLDALPHKHLAGAILDLANYLTREQMLAEHPAKARSKELIALLGALVQRLGTIEDEPDAADRSAQEVGAIIAQSLPLAVSLCDALALIGDPDAIGKLYQAMDLRHRRLRTEAAAALARLGEKAGVDILVELVVEPVARLRVLAYAQELDFVDRIDPEYSTDAARAEAQLALWLAQPSQFGIPPTKLELVDEREQFWPSFDEPVKCFLFRYHYDLGYGTLSNIGIAGPLEHTFAADLADLPPDDIYAAFAGWQVEHEELREYDVALLNEQQLVEVSRLERRLRDGGVEAITPQILALFFGERVLIASAVREGQPGTGIATSGGESIWFPRGNPQRPLGPREAYCIFKGRRLLRTFNP